MESDCKNRHEAVTAAYDWREFLPDVVAIYAALVLLHQLAEDLWSLVL